MARGFSTLLPEGGQKPVCALQVSTTMLLSLPQSAQIAAEEIIRWARSRDFVEAYVAAAKAVPDQTSAERSLIAAGVAAKHSSVQATFIAFGIPLKVNHSLSFCVRFGEKAENDAPSGWSVDITMQPEDADYISLTQSISDHVKDTSNREEIPAFDIRPVLNMMGVYAGRTLIW